MTAQSTDSRKEVFHFDISSPSNRTGCHRMPCISESYYQTFDTGRQEEVVD